MFEVNEAAKVITSSADSNAKVIFGSVIDPSLGDEVKITVIATGFGKGARPAAVKRIAQTQLNPFEDSERTPLYRPSAPLTSPPAPTATPTKRTGGREPLKPSTTGVPEKTQEEEELEIPAFIRKKMM